MFISTANAPIFFIDSDMATKNKFNTASLTNRKIRWKDKAF